MQRLRADQSHLLSTGQEALFQGLSSQLPLLQSPAQCWPHPSTVATADRLGMELPGVSGSLVLATRSTSGVT